MKLRYNKNSGFVSISGWPKKGDVIVKEVKNLLSCYKQRYRPVDGVSVTPPSLWMLIHLENLPVPQVTVYTQVSDARYIKMRIDG